MLLFNFLGPEIIVLFFGLFAIASLVLTLWAVIEIATKPFRKENDKVLWLIICLLLGGVGPLIYLTQRKKLLANPPGGSAHDNREYLPPLDDHLARPQEQSRLNDEDYV
jgi:O-antigen/teichoic acid export membrane protein